MVLVTRILLQTGGREFDLATRGGGWFRSVAYAGLSGLVGTKKATTLEVAGVPGEVAVSFRTQPMTGEITLHVFPRGSDDNIDRAVSEIRRELFPDRYATVVFERPSGTYSTQVRLNGPIDAPAEFPEDADYAEVRLPLISESGSYSGWPVSDTGFVTVINSGEEFLWPLVSWRAGGSITLPSTTRYTLPASAGGIATMSLDPITSHEVTVDDEVDETLSGVTGAMWLGEGVPEGQARDYQTDGDVTLTWAPRFLDPWR